MRTDDTKKFSDQTVKEIEAQKLKLAAILDFPEIQAMQKMAILGECASALGHEINNPLSVLRGYISGIKAAVSDGKQVDSRSLEKPISRMELAIERMTSIVAAVQSFSRNSIGDIPQEKSNLGKIITDSVILTQHCLSKSNIQITKEIEAGIDTFCRPSEISQILVNLLANACYALKDTTEPTIHIISKYDSEGKICITVRDNGCGISPSILPNIMNPFFTTKQPGEGTGLGLAISKQLAERNNATLKVDEVSTGSQFRITFLG